MTNDHAVLNPLLSLLEQRVGLRLHASATQTLGAFGALAAQLQISATELLERLSSDPALLEKLATQLTIPETHFFRVRPQIDALRDFVLPDLERRWSGARPLRLWSAGCSTGEEAYTLAILARQVCSQPNQVRILGTDLHPQSLELAQRGAYGGWSFRDTSERVRERYFSLTSDNPAQHQRPEWQIADRLRQMVRFQLHNLLSPDWSSVERFDLILCRNVMIYFSNLTAQRVIERLAAQLQPSGWLMLGPSDPPPLPATLERCGLKPHHVSGAIVYQRRAEGLAQLDTREPSPATVEWPLSEELLIGSDEPVRPTPAVDTTVSADVNAAYSAVAEREFSSEVQQQLHLGISALEIADLPAALTALRRAAYLEPQSALAQYLLAKTLMDSAQLGRARAVLRQAQRLLDASDSGTDSSTDLQLAVTALNLKLGQP